MRLCVYSHRRSILSALGIKPSLSKHDTHVELIYLACLWWNLICSIIDYLLVLLVINPTVSFQGSSKPPSPKVAEYMRTLAKRSPRKSPLSKYWRLKNNRSPLRSPAHQHPIKRVRLTFDTESGVAQEGKQFLLSNYWLYQVISVNLCS